MCSHSKLGIPIRDMKTGVDYALCQSCLRNVKVTCFGGRDDDSDGDSGGILTRAWMAVSATWRRLVHET